MLSIIGQVCRTEGLVKNVDLAGESHWYKMRSNSYRRDQPAEVPLHFNHERSWTLGEVGYFERSKADGLMAVAASTPTWPTC
jgi:hypothetical protein